MKLYTWTTPNGYKIPIMLEELGVEYELVPVNIQKGEQMKPEFLAMNPNHKIPVLVDEDPSGGPITIFESGAILIYLADKYGKFLSKDPKARYAAIEWLMFQMASIGPMFGQYNHFAKFAPEKIEYAIKRYLDESNRLVAILESQLAANKYIAGEYSIADMATWPWIRTGQNVGSVDLTKLPNLNRWYKDIESREAVRQALQKTDKAVKG